MLANVALSVLDDHFARDWKQRCPTRVDRARERRQGRYTCRLVRYADDFVVLVAGKREHAEILEAEVAQVLAPMGLRLSAEKTHITHIDEGFDFLGWRIKRDRQRGGLQRHVYTYPSKKSLATVKAKVRAITRAGRNDPLKALLTKLNPVIRGWTAYFRHGASSDTFRYLEHFTWVRVKQWLRHKHARTSWREIHRRYMPGWRPTEDGVTLYNAAKIVIERYRYRGAVIPTLWTAITRSETSHATA